MALKFPILGLESSIQQSLKFCKFVHDIKLSSAADFEKATEPVSGLRLKIASTGVAAAIQTVDLDVALITTNRCLW
jgi:hypothetical protein